MFKLSEIEHKLIEIMKTRGIDKDNVVGVMLTLKTDEDYSKLIEWFNEHDKAGHEEMMEYIEENYL